MAGTPSYFYFDNDVWVDEARAVFAASKKQNSERLQSLLHGMFSSHHDVYSLLLAFLRRLGKNRQPKHSLPRIAMVEFRSWLEERERKCQEESSTVNDTDTDW